MKKRMRILAVLLSLAVTLSGMPAMNVSANPATFSEEESVVEEIAEEVSVEEAVAEEATEDTSVEETVIEEAVTEETMVEETTKEAVEEETVTEEVVTEETATEETVTEEMTTEETTAIECETVANVANTEEVLMDNKASSVYALGSNGIAYDGVVYLSKATVKALPKDAQKVYREMCDNIAALYESGMDISDVVIAADNEKLSMQFKTSMRELFTEDRQSSFISENIELMESISAEEEIIESVNDTEIKEYNTLLKDDNFFRNQLSSYGKSIYDAGKNSIIKKGSNSLNVTVSGHYLANVYKDHFDAISALVNTYPNKFNWMDLSDDGEIGGWTIYYYGSRKTDIYLTIDKSKWYSSQLEKKANTQIKKLVNEAYAYAEAKYPNSPTYGIIKYFNDWIVDNNYYEDLGVDDGKGGRSKVYYYCHSCYGILLEGYGVCESYALAMTRLLDAAGIRNQYVVGDTSSGGHAWNYVQMPNGNWYLLDSTWNDSSGNQYFLVPNDGKYEATGRRFVVGKSFTFQTLSSSSYNSGTKETLEINKEEVLLKPNATVKLKVDISSNPGYYNKMKKTWSSSDKTVATVDKNGKVTAKSGGKATITCKIAGKAVSCTVYVYKFTGLTFTDNAKGSYTWEYANEGADFGSASTKTFTVSVGQQNAALTAAQLQTKLELDNPKVKVDKASVAEVSNISLAGDKITFKVKPKAVGKAVVTVNFGGKKATLTVNATQKIKSEWFDCSQIEDKEYTGKAFAPKVTKTKEAPKNISFKVTYENNKNAGDATVVIKGTGKYGGEIRESFKITQKDITGAKLTCSKSKAYNGKEQKATIKVKVGTTTLKEGTDYIVYYGKSVTVPANVGTYTVKIEGKGNYKGTLAQTPTYEITAASIKNIKVTCPATVKYTGSAVVPGYKVKIGTNVLPASDYKVSYIYKDGTESTTAPSVKGKHTLVITPKGNNVLPTETKTSIKVKYTIK